MIPDQLRYVRKCDHTIHTLLTKVTNGAHKITKPITYEGDLIAAQKMNLLKSWWNTLCRLGPKFGYCQEGTKSWLFLK